MYKVAVIEDDPALRGALCETLSGARYQVSTPVDFSLSADEYLNSVLAERPDLIVLDLNLPYQNGINLLKALRANQNNIPVVMITCSTSETDEVLAMGYSYLALFIILYYCFVYFLPFFHSFY